MAEATTRSIPSLDGLRAGSIALVIVGHCLAYLHGDAVGFPQKQLSELGQSGVDVFFVISGFLITHLLIREQDATGSIRLGKFYFRRFFRIFPPFYVYLAVVALLALAGWVHQDLHAMASAATYTWNYHPGGPSWVLAHTWSLSLEEQFYLLWPPCLALLGKAKSAYVAVGAVLFSPAIRFITYLVAPSMRGNEWTMLHTRLDPIMCGCAMALLWSNPAFHRWTARLLNPFVAALSIAYVALAAPCLSTSFGARYDWAVGYSLRALLISALLLYVVKKPATPLGKFLNLPVVKHVGVISYSLYLWQQLFTGANDRWFPFNIIAILVCAELSYLLIERPAFRARDWFATRLASESVLPAAAGMRVQGVRGEG